MTDNIIVIALCVLFTWKCFQPGMIFGSIGTWAEENLPEWLYNPLFGCPVCMSVWIGGLFYALGVVSGIISPSNLAEVIFTLFGAGGLNTALIGFGNED